MPNIYAIHCFESKSFNVGSKSFKLRFSAIDKAHATPGFSVSEAESNVFIISGM
ncbi:hypothetical protein C900_03033 [Fulvivirga imtechensis AK7]|uniref:Uncharacterized protein n=1 Tax=Fulvivirga imtechensis AK7 TaxID=1237149 RepID=L8JU39_9BACT|nr:hypothetical protein C900_03033 [Fulvivirga imtechensis AK7]